MLRPHVAHDPIARARLEREATTLQKVSHPGVAGILDHDLQSERPYLVTRFVPGRPLDEQVDDRGPLTPQRGCRWPAAWPSRCRRSTRQA